MAVKMTPGTPGGTVSLHTQLVFLHGVPEFSADLVLWAPGLAVAAAVH